jgi:hypothetical protein
MIREQDATGVAHASHTFSQLNLGRGFCTYEETTTTTTPTKKGILSHQTVAASFLGGDTLLLA